MEQQPNQKSLAKAILPYTTVALILAIGYVSWVFYSRWRENQDAIEAAEARKTQQEKQVVDAVFGNGEVKINNFYPVEQHLKHGQTGSLCYSIVNAKTVTMDPPATTPLKTGFSRCVDVKPTKTTTYTLTADDGAGHKATAKMTLFVQ